MKFLLFSKFLHSVRIQPVISSRTLYLAVPLDVYQTFFQLEFTQTAVQRYQILLVVYNPVNEEIVKWIK